MSQTSHHPPTPQTWSQVYEELNHRVYGIVSELLTSTGSGTGDLIYVSYEQVVSILLDRYRVTDLRQLHVIHGTEVAVLHCILSLQTKLQVFLQSFLCSRAILCLKELEIEVIRYLKSFQIQSVHQVYRSVVSPSSSGKTSDPNEIDLDDDQPLNSDVIVINTFQDYGIGSLHQHPYVMAIFGPIAIGGVDMLTTEDVMQHLQRYLMEKEHRNGSTTGTSKSTDFSVHDFITFLLQQYSVGSLSELGVVLRGDLHDVVLSLKHVLREGHRLEAEIINMQLKQLKQQHRDLIQGQDAQQTERIKIVKAAPVLLPPVKESLLASFLQHVQEGCMGESLFSPSHGKIATYIKQCLEANRADKKDTTTSKGKRKRDLSAEDEIYEAAAEYAFLQLGSKKQVANRYESGNMEDGEGVVESKDVSGCTETEPQAIADHVSKEAVSSVIPMVSNSVSSTESVPFDGRMTVGRVDLEEANELIEVVHPSQLSSIIPQLSHLPIDHNDLSTVGRYGESLVYHYLQASAGLETRIEWLNETEESKACYDFILHTKQKQTFLEVKATRFVDNNVFQISLWEWDFLHKLPKVDYQIIRVFGVGDPLKTRVVVYKDIVKLVELGRVKLCLAV